MSPCLQQLASTSSMLKACRSVRPFTASRGPTARHATARISQELGGGTHVTCAGTRPTSSKSKQDQCCSSQASNTLGVSRRDAVLSAASVALALAGLAQPPVAMAGGIGRYIKRKALDPLDTYVPLVLEARQQLQRVGDVMGDSPVTARDLLRSGPFSGLRDNIRAIGEYAAGSNSSSDAGGLVLGFFQELEGLDRLLYEAVRDKKPVAQDEAAEKLKATVAALDSLVATVPADVLERSQQIVQRIQGGSSSPAAVPGSADVEQLQQLLSGST